VRSNGRRGLIGIAVLAATLSSLFLTTEVGAEQTTRPEQYLISVRRAIAVARSGIAMPSGVRMDRVRSAVGPVVLLTPNGEEAVPADPFIAHLSGSSSRDFRVAVVHLRTLAASVRALSLAAPIDRPRLRRALAGAYRGIDSSPGLLDRIRRAFGSVVSTIGSYLARLGGHGGVLLWILAAGLALGIWFLVRRFGMGFVPERYAPSETDAALRADPRAEADAALARGDLEGAVRALYHALVDALAARGVLREVEAITAGECRRSVARALPVAESAVDRATRSFERVVYGRTGGEPFDVEALRDAMRTVESR